MTTVVARLKALSSTHPHLWKVLALDSIIGLVFLLINFPTLLERVIPIFVGDKGVGSALLRVVQGAQLVSAEVIGPDPQGTFRTLMCFIFIGLWVYIMGLVVFSLRHRRLAFVAWGFVGLFIGTIALHLTSLIALIAIIIVQLLKTRSGLDSVSLGDVFALFTRYGWLVLTIPFLSYFYGKFREHWVKILIGACLVFGGGYILYLALPSVWHRSSNLLQPVIEFVQMLWNRYIGPIIPPLLSLVGMVLFIGTSVIIVLGVLTTVGHPLVDQIRAAWHAGSGRKGVVLSAFAIGTALGLVFLVSIATPELADCIDDGWTESWQRLGTVAGIDLAAKGMAHVPLTNTFEKSLPLAVRDFVFQYLTTASAPLFDASLLLLVLLVSCVGMLRRSVRRMPATPEPVPVTFYPAEFISASGEILQLVLQVILAFAPAKAEDEE